MAAIDLEEPQAPRVVLRNVRTHNLKGIDCDVPHGMLTAVTGPSGSGKSSLAFDTLYAEGQRRYTESLSTYARQFLQQMARPPVDVVHSIQPAVALRQKNDVSHARSTVSTITEIDDHLQLLFTHAGVTTCPTCDVIVERDTPASAADALLESDEGTRIVLVANVDVADPELRPTMLKQLTSEGYSRFYLDGQTTNVEDIEADRLLGLERLPVVIDRLAIRREDRQRLAEALEAGFAVGNGRVDVHFHDSDDEPITFDRSYRCNVCGREFVEPQPALFSFNSSLGACDNCSGFGKTIGIDFTKVIPDERRSVLDGAVQPWRSGKHKRWQKKLIEACTRLGVPLDIPFRDLPHEAQDIIREGEGGWVGIRGFFTELRQQKHKTHVRIFLAKFRGYGPCEACHGTRLSEEARNVRFQGKRISDFWRQRIEVARTYFDELEVDAHTEGAVGVLLEEIRHRLSYLDEIGVGYLTLDRSSRTLSGGEMQRIHLTTSLGRSLTDTLYVLDEPTAGLHARDSRRLLEVLYELRDLGNTVVVVEHDPEIIEGADYVLELGPGGGENGGELVYAGSFASFSDADTVTSRSLKERIPVGDKIEDEPVAVVSVIGAMEHNLDGVDVHFPVGRLSAVTGVSGSGKSTLMQSVLYNGWRRSRGQVADAGVCDALEGLERFDDVIFMDQSALGRSTRSNPLSYSKAYDDVRRLFAGTREAKMAGLSSGDFSFNSPGGRCETCAGLGFVTVEMHFLADVELPCEDCGGRRFTQRVLDVKYRGKNIFDVLGSTVDEAVEFFGNHDTIVRKLEPLQQVGLGYIRLGQATSTLSGGEAQRLKLASYIAQADKRSRSEEYLFIFDEPTVGLHIRDVEVLVSALRTLVDQGHTVIVIEHNIDFVAQCDFLVDLGPEAGPEGGEVVAFGTPENVAAEGAGHTAKYLFDYFEALATESRA
jgi:excinuclease ABC subunit A